MKVKVRCKVCGFEFVDNPEKHKYRPKYCPKCREPYKGTFLNFKPNLNWIRQRIEKLRGKKLERQMQEQRRQRKSMETSRKMIDEWYERLSRRWRK